MSAPINKVVLLGGSAGGGSGDVVGPASATDNAIVRFDGTSGTVVQNSAVTIADTTGAMTFANTGSFISLAGTTPSTGVGTGALQVAGGIYAGAASSFAGSIAVTSASGIQSAGNLTLTTATNSRINWIAGQTAWLNYNLAADSFSFRHTTSGVTSLTLTEAAATFAGAVTAQGLFYPQQATTAGAPAYVKGAIYFDTTLNKLRVGGASAWETITSV